MTESSSSSQQQAQPLLQIRHEGKAHIRGRIRRVWRPRYLELLADGRLQYYELPAKELKYTLTVTSARILDVTTIRDLHTGLPRGSFGFLVRGQRSMPHETTTAATVNNTSSLIFPPDSSSPKHTTSTSNNNDAGLLLDNTVSPMAAFLLAETEPPVRDYLCAVTTLEDAQMWVVALQWAASLAPPPSTEQWWKVDYAIFPQSPSIVITESSSSPLAAAVPRELPDTAASKTTNIHKTPVPPKVEEPPKGKVLITAVTGYTVIRLTAWTLEIAYEIHAMLLYPNNNTTSSGDGAYTAEQWSMRRTAAQLQQLVREFRSDATTAAAAGDCADDDDDDSNLIIRRLPRWSHRPAAHDVERSLSIVDSLLRSWVLSADLVNTAALKRFLGLTEKSDDASLSWWQAHSDHPFAVMTKCQKTVPANMTNDQYVKEWLQEVRSSSIGGSRRAQQLAVQLRHDQSMNLVWLGGAVAACGVLPAAYRLWQKVMPVISIRLDYLIVSWASAAYLGRRLGQRRRDTESEPRSGKRKTSAKRMALTKPRIQTNKKSAQPLRKTNPKEQASSPAIPNESRDDLAVMVHTHKDEKIVLDYEDDDDVADFVSTGSQEVDDDDDESDGEATGEGGVESEDELAAVMGLNEDMLSSPLPRYPENDGFSCWSQPAHDIFHVRGVNYFNDKVKVSSGPGPLKCRGVDIWMTDNPERHIARHPAVLGGKLGEEDTFLVNFLLPFGNFVAYFAIPPVSLFPDKLGTVWTKFLKGDQQYRDARLKLLPVVVDGPWIVKTAVGPGKSPALLGKAIPLQYFFRDPEPNRKGVYEVDVIITASAIAKGILSVVKSQTKAVTIAFAFIIEAAEQSELPETVLCSFQVHSLHLEDCPILPECNLDGV
jgi:Protein ENHANCED DISEASE RESISTANCE 2, C-terminal